MKVTSDVIYNVTFKLHVIFFIIITVIVIIVVLLFQGTASKQLIVSTEERPILCMEIKRNIHVIFQRGRQAFHFCFLHITLK